jgi:hypothetical protein
VKPQFSSLGKHKELRESEEGIKNARKGRDEIQVKLYNKA